MLSRLGLLLYVLLSCAPLSQLELQGVLLQNLLTRKLQKVWYWDNSWLPIGNRSDTWCSSHFSSFVLCMLSWLGLLMYVLLSCTPLSQLELQGVLLQNLLTRKLQKFWYSDNSWLPIGNRSDTRWRHLLIDGRCPISLYGRLGVELWGPLS